jgi:hypothetical protein
VRLAGAGATEQAERGAGVDPAGVGEVVDVDGVDVGVLVVFERVQAFGSVEVGLADQAGCAALVAFGALGA